MPAVNFTAIPCKPNIANRHIESYILLRNSSLFKPFEISTALISYKDFVFFGCSFYGIWSGFQLSVESNFAFALVLLY